jgi:uncharacterized membrane protein YdbT with pleckstrin-like domain
MLGPINRFFEGLTDLKPEDLLPDEEILLSATRVWYSELMMMIISVIAIVGSVSLYAYAAIEKISGLGRIIINLLSVVCFPAGIFFAAGLVMDHYSVRYFLTNFRVIKRTGVFSKKLIYVQYDKIQDVKLTKSISERVVDMGDIYLDTSGGPEVELNILDVPDPEKIHRIILEQMEKHGIGH